MRTLQQEGYDRRYPEPRIGFDARFAKSVTMWSAAGHEIDLHRTLVLGPFGLRVQLDDLWSNRDTFGPSRARTCTLYLRSSVSCMPAITPLSVELHIDWCLFATSPRCC